MSTQKEGPMSSRLTWAILVIAVICAVHVSRPLVSRVDTHEWTRQLGTYTDEYSLGVSADQLGNVFIAGSTTGSLETPRPGAYQDAFVSKYDSNGVLKWTRQLGSPLSEFNEGVAADGLGNV